MAGPFAHHHPPLTTHHLPVTILVCDDETHILHAVTFKLSTAGGFKVIQAANGREAIGLLETHTPDLVITDCQMPEVDGFGLCRHLRGRPQTATTPIIMLTAKALELDEEQVKSQWNISEILMKPFSPRGLLNTVQRALKLSVTARAVAS
ncbi:MAG: response regulator [Planctomycetes bacterium]|nr:response regulator [Planctomycetota bacterium]